MSAARQDTPVDAPVRPRIQAPIGAGALTIFVLVLLVGGVPARSAEVLRVETGVVASHAAATKLCDPMAGRRATAEDADREVWWLVRSFRRVRSVQDATLPAPRAPGSVLV